jgi:hypothetical protein
MAEMIPKGTAVNTVMIPASMATLKVTGKKRSHSSVTGL